MSSQTKCTGVRRGWNSIARDGVMHAAVRVSVIYYVCIYIFIKVHIYYIHVKHVCRCWRADLVLPLLVEDGKRKDCFRDLQHHMPPSKLDPCISMSLLLQAQTADYKHCSVQLLKTEPA